MLPRARPFRLRGLVYTIFGTRVNIFWQITFSANTYFFTMPEGIQKGPVILRPFSLSKNPGADKGPQPLMFTPALTTQGELPRRGKRRPPGGCASERMITHGFSYFAGFAARRPAAAGQFRPVSRGVTSCFMQEAKPVKLEKVAFSHFFDSIKKGRYTTGPYGYCDHSMLSR